MKILITEDSFICRNVLLKVLSEFGDCDMAVNGLEAVFAWKAAQENQCPYDLICLDIMMPEKDGHDALREIRKLEGASGSKFQVPVIMTTVKDDSRNIMQAFNEQCEAYLVKPVSRKALFDAMHNLNLVNVV